jgi:hypothetical protein
MSMADALLQERQRDDGETRRRVVHVIRTLERKIGTQAPGDIGAIEGKRYSISHKERAEILTYLRRFADGGHLV